MTRCDNPKPHPLGECPAYAGEPIIEAARALVAAANAVLMASRDAPRIMAEPLARLDATSDALGALLEE